MRLTAQTRVFLRAGEEVFRKPSFWDKFKTFVGSDVDLRTGEISIAQNALATTEQVQQAFKLAKVTNAVSLVVDKDIVFQDLHDKADDADLLLEAAHRNAARFTQPFQVIRVVFEWEGHGIHTLIEAVVRCKFKPQEPAVILSYGARIDALRPHDGEDQDAARDRIGKALGDKNLVPLAKNALDQLVARVEAALARAFAGSTLETDHADVQVVKPSNQDVRDMAGGWDHHHNPDVRSAPAYSGYGGGYGWGQRYYDPWGTYYRDPMDTFVNLMILDALVSPHHYHSHWGWDPHGMGHSWSSYGAPVTIVNYNGTPYGTADHITDFQGSMGDVSSVAQSDFSSAGWEDSALSGYDSGNASFDQYGSGTAAAAGTWDCADGSGGGGDSGTSAPSSDCSFDCSSDCSSDCAASDCSWDCSSDCSSDCGGSDW